LIVASKNTARYENDTSPRGDPRPLVEDFAMRGLLWADRYFPQTWFAHEISDDDKWFEMASFMDERRMRCLWLGVRIAKHQKWIKSDAESRAFSVCPFLGTAACLTSMVGITNSCGSGGFPAAGRATLLFG
jgi:hypothetical protein